MTGGTARRARLLDASLAHLPRFKRADWQPYEPARECDPSFTLEQHIAEGKRDAKRWAELNAEWEN